MARLSTLASPQASESLACLDAFCQWGTVNTAPLSHDEARNIRLHRLLETCIDVSFGTVWRVREELWRERFREEGQPYDEEGTRQWHPGISMWESPLASLFEFLPMLHGSTGDHGPVVVRGLTRECGPAHPTSFGRIVRPARISAKEITSTCPDAQKNRLTGWMIYRRRVTANLHKPKLDQSELAELRSWAKRRGLL